MILWHGTSRAACDGIEAEGVLRPSGNGIRGLVYQLSGDRIDEPGPSEERRQFLYFAPLSRMSLPIAVYATEATGIDAILMQLRLTEAYRQQLLDDEMDGGALRLPVPLPATMTWKARILDLAARPPM